MRRRRRTDRITSPNRRRRPFGNSCGPIPTANAALDTPSHRGNTGSCRRFGTIGRRQTLRAAVIEANPEFPLLSERREIEVTGARFIQTLRALTEAGPKGVTALEMSSWALRLAHYIHILRTKYGLDIETRNEPHEGGKHGRYFLRSTVVLIDADASDGRAVA